MSGEIPYNEDTEWGLAAANYSDEVIAYFARTPLLGI